MNSLRNPRIGYARFMHHGAPAWGRIDFETDRIHVLSRTYLEGVEPTGETVDLIRSSVELLPPCLPGKIICIGLNYRDHARELNLPIPKEPVIFLKPSSSLIGDRGTIVYPPGVGRLDYEAELAVVIGRRCRSVPTEAAPAVVLGYTCFNDVTARDLQHRDGQWTRSKSFDTFAPIGPWIVSGIDPGDLGIRARLNGSIVQESRTSNMIFGVAEAVSFVSGIMTLNPGDVISLGTPPGVGPMQRGDTIVVDIDSVGTLTNHVA
jgi:2-keto-4-pentenoate hydratase/2-oxohepta-3-ene-1,7-dioic acid hydratase in catechol pathway